MWIIHIVMGTLTFYSYIYFNSEDWGLEELLLKTRLRWCGHVRRREKGYILRRALNFEVEGRRPPGRPKKTWRVVAKEDVRMLNIKEEMAMDRQQWRRLISPTTPPLGINGR